MEEGKVRASNDIRTAMENMDVVEYKMEKGGTEAEGDYKEAEEGVLWG